MRARSTIVRPVPTSRRSPSSGRSSSASWRHGSRINSALSRNELGAQEVPGMLGPAARITASAWAMSPFAKATTSPSPPRVTATARRWTRHTRSPRACSNM
ncbi:Uncharacterised protein [Mycobacteroides abscessus subsp. abscessus]|nr:Uncharacterised protein [Mycobacteroides abscessus subsp. abscessus]